MGTDAAGRRSAGVNTAAGNGTAGKGTSVGSNASKVTAVGSTKETRFLWDGSRLVAQLGEDSFFFHYDGSGTMTGYTYVSPSDAGTECLFVRNLQGDVKNDILILTFTEKFIGLDGSVLASYTYDAWGMVHRVSAH